MSLQEEERLREALEELEMRHSSMISARDLTIRDLRNQLVEVRAQLAAAISKLERSR